MSTISDHPSTGSGSIRFRRLAMIGMFLFMAGHLAGLLHDHFSQPDSGMLCQVAERTLNGEWPHIDFDDPYTGLGAFLHAGAFALLGPCMSSIRLVHLLMSLLGLAAFLDLAWRARSLSLAAAAAGLGFFMSYPVAFEAMPSWYILDLGLVATALLLRWEESGSPVLLALAGLTLGVATLFKVTGVYLIVAVIPWLLLAPSPNHQQCLSRPILAEKQAWRLSTPVMVVVPPLLLLIVVFRILTPQHLFFYIVPIIVLLVAGLVRFGATSLPIRVILGRVGMFGCGALVPFLLFGAVYAWRGGLSALWYGIYVAPQQRFKYAYEPLGNWLDLGLGLIPALLFLPSRGASRTVTWWGTWILLGITGLLIGTLETTFSRLIVWKSLANAFPWVALAVAGRLMRGPTSPAYASRLLLVSLMAGFQSLIQYPISIVGIYFSYVAPLAVLPLLFLLDGERPDEPDSGRGWAGVVLVCYTALAWIHMGNFWFISDRPDTRQGPYLSLACDARVSTHTAHRLTTLNQEVARVLGARDLWIGPDAPDLYFYLGRRNRTRHLYDFLSPPTEYDKILRLIRAGQIGLTVFNGRNPHVLLPADGFWMEVRRLLPETKSIDGFTLFWRKE